MSVEDKAWRDYSERFRREVLPNLLNSATFLSIHSDDPDFDVRQATELGAALLLGKPTMFVVPRGRSLPDGLRRAADIVVDDWEPADPDAQERIADAVRQVMNRS